MCVVHYPPPGGRAPLSCLARLESDYTNDIRLATNGNLLTMRVPRDLIDRPRVFVLGHESAVLQQGITSAGFYEQKKSKTIQPYLDAVNVEPTVVATGGDIPTRDGLERDRVDIVARARKSVQARAGVGVPQLGGRVERAAADPEMRARQLSERALY